MKDKITKIIELSEEILKNIELNEIPLSEILLKCARLARFTGNQKAIELFNYELKGYPTDEQGRVLYEAFELSRHVNRTFKEKDKAGISREFLVVQTVAELEAELSAARTQLSVAQDSDISISSANPQQYVMPPIGNTFERMGLRQIITDKSKKLHQLKNGYYTYVAEVYYQYKFEGITEGIFERRKRSVEKVLEEKLPDSIQKFITVYDNLRSSNSEDWASAVHSCRRILKDVADYLYPASNEEIILPSDTKKQLNEENYILRLKQYVIKKSTSSNFNKVVGSNLKYVGDRIDSIYSSTTKGSHTTIEREEAERYIIYTYLLLGDILSL